MRAKFLATAATALLVSCGLAAGTAQAQVKASHSQLTKDANKKDPAAADAALATTHAKVAKQNAMIAKNAARDPKAKAAADSAAKAADIAARTAAAATKEAEKR